MKFFINHLGKISFLISIVVLFVALSLHTLINQESNNNTINAVIDNGRNMVNQYKKLRSYYTKNVVSVAKKNGNLKIHYNHQGIENTIPLPATMIHDLSNVLKADDKSGVKLKLYSAFPFPHREEQRKTELEDPFIQEAINFFSDQKNADKEFSKVYMDEGKEKLRFAISDKMTLQGCVNCHNSHKETPKADWKLGDIRGILEVETPIAKQLTANNQLTTKALGSVSLIIVLIFFLLLLTYIKVKDQSQKTKAVLEVAHEMAEGNLCQSPELKGQDDISLLSQSINQAKKSLGQMISTIKKNSFILDNHSNQLNQASNELSSDLSEIKEDTDKVIDASEAMRNNIEIAHSDSKDMKKITENAMNKSNSVAENMNSVAAAIEESQISLTSIAEASEQMTLTINEIAENTERCHNISDNAVKSVDSATTKVNDLVAASSEIESVIDIIVEISEQTKNLALNATIEAARAGEAGKGFAVVANEVKELAKQTSDATVNIRESINKMTECSSETVGEIGSINDIIKEVSAIVTTISAAIEEQSISIKDNSENVSQAADGIKEVTERASITSSEANEIAEIIETMSNNVANISDKCTDAHQKSETVKHNASVIDQSVANSSENEENVNRAANELSKLSKELNDLLKSFKID